MFAKRVLTGLVVLGALVAIPAAASAYEPYHHGHYESHYYRPYYYTPYIPPVVITPAPIVVAPIERPVDVLYRSSAVQPWTLYNSYSSRYDADLAARRLENGGYSVMIQLR